MGGSTLTDSWLERSTEELTDDQRRSAQLYCAERVYAEYGRTPEGERVLRGLLEQIGLLVPKQISPQEVAVPEVEVVPEVKAKSAPKLRRGSLSVRLLEAHAASREPLIDEEAANLAGITNPRVGYWKRCSELRQHGYLTFVRIHGVPVERRSSVGEWCQTSMITAAGQALLRELALAQ